MGRKRKSSLQTFLSHQIDQTKKKIGEKNVHSQKSIKKRRKIHLTTYEICFGNVINLGLKAQEWRRLKYIKKNRYICIRKTEIAQFRKDGKLGVFIDYGC